MNETHTMYLPLNPYTKTSRPRKQTCTLCGFTVKGNTSLHLFNKAWNANHLGFHIAYRAAMQESRTA